MLIHPDSAGGYLRAAYRRNESHARATAIKKRPAPSPERAVKSAGARARYSPFQLGLRFSAKARGPSIKSFDWNSFLVAEKFVLFASSSGICNP